MGLGGWCGIGGWINLLELCEGSIARNGNCEGFGALGSNIVAVETKTWGERVRKWLNNLLIHLHNYTAGKYRDGGYCIVVGEKGGWCEIGGVNQLT